MIKRFVAGFSGANVCPHWGRALRSCGLVVACISLAACSETSWNNPYPVADAEKSIYYSSFSERPKHLDPVSSYSEKEDDPDDPGLDESTCGTETNVTTTSKDLAFLIDKYKTSVDPLVRITMDINTTTAAERSIILRSANNFCERGPNAEDAPVVPMTLHGFGFVNPGANSRTLRFAGAMQVGIWIADVQARPFTHAPRSTRFQIELTSDNGRQWSAAVAIDC